MWQIICPQVSSRWFSGNAVLHDKYSTSTSLTNYWEIYMPLQLRIITDKGANDVWIREARRSGTWWTLSTTLQRQIIAMTLSVLGWYSSNWATEAAQLAEFKSSTQGKAKQSTYKCGWKSTCKFNIPLLFSGIHVVKAMCPIYWICHVCMWSPMLPVVYV